MAGPIKAQHIGAYMSEFWEMVAAILLFSACAAVIITCI
jgi:hypothetical protein